MAYQVQVDGLKELMNNVARAGGDARPLVKAAIVNSVNRIQSQVRARAAHRTGTLQRSVLTTVTNLMGIVQVNEKYGIWVEEGTGLYGPYHQRIVPRSAKALAFTYMGKKVFARSTAGMHAQPFFRPGVEDSVQYVQTQFDMVGDRLAREMAGRS